MSRLLIAAALLLLPTRGLTDPMPTVAPMPPLPPVLAPLDTQVRTGAELAPTDPFCDHRDVVSASLLEDYHEEIVEQAGMVGGRGLELWASPDSGTWTLVFLRADGVACVADYGEGWEPGAPSHPLMAELGVTA